MAGLDTTGSNPDVSLLYDINGLAGDSPDWLTGSVAFVGEYGLLLALVLLVIWCWWGQRKRATLDDAASSVAAVVWAPLAAGLAVLVNVPIRGFVERRRPFKDHDGLELLVHGKTDFSFVSDHATLAMALGVGLFVANRKFGLVGIALALLEGFCRVFMGVHYPTDVVGGFALGTAVALLLSPLAMAVLTPVAKAVGRTGRGGRLVWAGSRDEAVAELPRRSASESESGAGAGAGAGSDERDLAA
ncbi:phosphatase PAP2 family protein [Streptomyces longisporoflavus]|uniref:Phosphatase PAP2 family protein n=1 Tax=Streptomyces longisporoflavus TaxID=28044 RepID=A0ABW7QZF6_9ACTN